VLLRSLEHKIYKDFDRIWLSRGHQTLPRDRVTTKVVFFHTGYYAIVPYEVVMRIATQTMEKIHFRAPLKYHDVHHHLAGHVIKLVCHRNNDDVE
jgi:hypothetical protein